MATDADQDNAAPTDPERLRQRIRELEAALARLQADNNDLQVRLQQQPDDEQARLDRLEVLNMELETFGQSVAHNLRTPLWAIGICSEALQENYSTILDFQGRDNLRRIRVAVEQMERLIEGLLRLSYAGSHALEYSLVDLSALAASILGEIREREPARQVEIVIAEGLQVVGDLQLLWVALGNLLENAWKFTSRQRQARIEFGHTTPGAQPTYFVRDNGAGFDMQRAPALFRPFQRLHNADEFPGTGIGLMIVQRIIQRHGGKIWAEGAIEQGATFFFTLPDRPTLA